MTGDDERYARVKHQGMFLFERGLVSSEMNEWNSRLSLLERLAGRDPSKLDPHLRERLHSELEGATFERLRETGLFEAWQESWDARAEEDAGSGAEPLAPPRPLPIRL